MCSKLKFKDSPNKCLVKSAEYSKLAVQYTLDDPWTFYCFMCSCCLKPTFWDGNGKNYRQFSHIFYNFLVESNWMLARWFFTACFVVVRLAGASRLHISLANTVSLQGSCNQMWPNLMLKRSTLHSKTTRNPYFVSHYVSSPIPWRNSRDDPEFDRFKSWTRRPSVFSCQALFECLRQNSALKNLNLWENAIGAEGAKAWCLARIVWMRGKQANEAFSKWRQREWTFVLKWEVGSREYVIIPC